MENEGANESHYRIILPRDSELIDLKLANSFLTDCEQIQNLLNSSIKTAKINHKIKI
jgi:hypothetical protein